ncbi:MAG: hypothetical protein EKK48_21835 [Candidatus Melainabacteria bacterium]|nr:MAG: hypothetical protein EKK48_21835 [Candidatus Melainabacteria bacterium]
MKEDFQNFIFNTLNGTVDKLRGNATAFEKKLKTFSDNVDGSFSMPQAHFDSSSSNLEPRYRELSGSLATLVTSLPLVQVGYKQWNITFAGWWQAPPPFGPMVVVSAAEPLQREAKLSIKTKKLSDLTKILSVASSPSDKAIWEFLKSAMPNWQHQDFVANELLERELWMKLPKVRAGTIELDRICTVTSNESDLARMIFSDWKAREAYLRLAPRSEFLINGSRDLITLVVHSTAEEADLKDALEFFKSLLDRSQKLHLSR